MVVADVLIFGDTIRSQELRHEVPVMIPDAFLYAERDGVRHIAAPRSRSRGSRRSEATPSIPFEEFGFDELRRTNISRVELIDELAVRAAHALGVSDALVPASFPVVTADRLRAAGVVLTRRSGELRLTPAREDAGSSSRYPPRADGGRGRNGRGARAAPRARRRAPAACSSSTGSR